MPEEQEKLPKPLTDLPAPQDDLPLPEKDLPAGRQELSAYASESEAVETSEPIEEKPVEEKKESDGNGFPFLKSFVFGFIFIVTLIAFGTIYFLSQSKSKNVQYTKTQISAPSPSPNLKSLGNPPEGEINYSLSQFEKRSYKNTDKIFDKIPYPNEMTSKSDSQLISFKCTPNYFNNNSGILVRSVDGEFPRLDDPVLIYLAQKAGNMHGREIADSVLTCLTVNNDQYVVYGIWNGGGGMDNVAYIGKINPDKTILEIANIPNDGTPYFGCNKIFQIDNKNIYVQCGGGDIGSSSSIYKINLTNKTKAQLLQCSSGPTNDDFDHPNSKIECSDGQTINLN